MPAPALSHLSQTPLAEWELQAQIQQALDSKFTGQIQVAFLNQRSETLFIHEGNVLQVYIRNHRTPDLNWKHPLVRFGRGTLELTPLSLRAMRFYKVFVEELQPAPAQRASTVQLKAMFALAEHNPHPTLFQIRWHNAQGYMLVAGKDIPIRQAVFLTATEIHEGEAALQHMLAWEETGCDLTIRRGDIKSQAWLELHLAILFEWHCQNILRQYGQLTGGVVVRSILHNTTLLAHKRGWQIVPQDQFLRDASFFQSAAEAGEAYRAMLSFIQASMTPIIGSALTGNLVQQARATVRDIYRTVEEVFYLLEETA